MGEFYDAVILGVGAGAKHLTGSLRGRSVAIIERHLVGGECPYVSCVTSRAMPRNTAVCHEFGSVRMFECRACGRVHFS